MSKGPYTLVVTYDDGSEDSFVVRRRWQAEALLWLFARLFSRPRGNS